MQKDLIDLIIMQIALVPDGLAPATLLFWFHDCSDRHLGWAPFFQCGGQAQFFNFFNFTIWRLILNLNLKSVIFTFIIASFDPD